MVVGFIEPFLVSLLYKAKIAKIAKINRTVTRDVSQQPQGQQLGR